MHPYLPTTETCRTMLHHRSPLRRALPPALVGLLLATLLLAGCGTAGSSPPPQAGPVTPYRYTPPKPSGHGPLVVAVGDMVCAPGGRVTETTCRDKEAARLAAQYHPRQLLALGDEQYGNGSSASYRAAYAKTWGRLRGITRPVPGDDAYQGDGYYAYFQGRTRPPGYDSFQVGSWRVYALNDNCTKIDCDTELAWLDEEMREHPTTCSAIMSHTPLYASGIQTSGNPRVVRPFWRVALAHGADLALAGHMHQYERMPRLGLHGRRDPHGMTQLVAGTGGKSMRPLVEGRAGYSQAFDNSTAGVLSLRLNDGGFGWRYRTVDGYNIDAGSRDCT